MGKAIFKLKEGGGVNFHEALFMKKEIFCQYHNAVEVCAEVVIFEAFLPAVHGFWMEANANW